MNTVQHRKHIPEPIVRKLREADRLLAATGRQVWGRQPSREILVDIEEVAAGHKGIQTRRAGRRHRPRAGRSHS
jgi:hypothetical protein